MSVLLRLYRWFRSLDDGSCPRCGQHAVVICPTCKGSGLEILVGRDDPICVTACLTCGGKGQI